MQYALSVIIPVYNAGDYIIKCLNTVISQNIDRMEIIVVNDGSTDATLDILRQYVAGYSNIKIISIVKKGVAHARNVGLRAAKGRYVTFVDADDYIEADMYQTMLSVLEQYNADIVECSCRKVKPNGGIIDEKHLQPGILEGDECLRHYLKQEGIQNYMCNKVYKKALFVGKSFPLLKYSEDYYMNVSVHKAAIKKVVIPDIFYNYVIHQNSACGRMPGLDRYDGVKAGIKALNIIEGRQNRHYAAVYVCKYCIACSGCMDNETKRKFVRLVRKDYIYALLRINPVYLKTLYEYIEMVLFAM